MTTSSRVETQHHIRLSKQFIIESEEISEENLVVDFDMKLKTTKTDTDCSLIPRLFGGGERRAVYQLLVHALR